VDALRQVMDRVRTDNFVLLRCASGVDCSLLASQEPTCTCTNMPVVLSLPACCPVTPQLCQCTNVPASHCLLAPPVVCPSGDVVSETSLRAQLLTHHVREAVMTVLLGRRRVPASQETKAGRPPSNVDYIGA
jgi:hypothetical protein